MDRFAANTLRTLGIIVTSMFVILGCLVLLALALCFGILAKAGGTGHADPQTSELMVGALIGTVVLVAIGVFIITKLAKGMVRTNGTPPPASYTLIPPSSSAASSPPAHETTTQKAKQATPEPPPPPPLSDEAKLDRALASFEAMAAKRAEPPRPEEPKEVSPPPAPTTRVPVGDRTSPRSLDVHHLSPASRIAIQQLGLAIAGKIVAEVALGIVGWFGALGAVNVPFPVYRFGFLAWGLAAIAPHLVLLYALARRPGPRAFAYSLVIPSLHLLFGLFGHSAFLAFVLRAGQMATPLLSITPWLFDILILYLAWKAIRKTGIEPSPRRLIVASFVILLYTSMLPPLVIFLNFHNP